MNARPICCIAAAFVFSLGSTAQSAELLAWNGGQVDLLNSSTITTPSFSATGVDSANSGAKLGGLITLDNLLNTIVYVDGYMQFAITADSGYDLQVEDFRLHTSAVSVSALTFLTVSSTEGGTYTELVSLGEIIIGSNTFTIQTPETISAGTTKYFRLSSLLMEFTFSQGEASVLSFNGSATPVPEPSTYAMATLGAGTLGYLGRRRRKAARIS
jgi:hypothetical protein